MNYPLSSDKKTKKNIKVKKTSDCLTVLNNITLEEFNWKWQSDSEVKSYGFDASTLSNIMPSNLTSWMEAGPIPTDSNGIPNGQPTYTKCYSMDNDMLIMTNLGAIKELNNLIIDLTARIDKLEKKYISNLI